MLLQQTTGQPNVLYYAQSIFESAGFDRQQAMYIDIMVGTIKLVATLAAVPFVDRSGYAHSPTRPLHAPIYGRAHFTRPLHAPTSRACF